MNLLKGFLSSRKEKKIKSKTNLGLLQKEDVVEVGDISMALPAVVELDKKIEYAKDSFDEVRPIEKKIELIQLNDVTEVAQNINMNSNTGDEAVEEMKNALKEDDKPKYIFSEATIRLSEPKPFPDYTQMRYYYPTTNFSFYKESVSPSKGWTYFPKMSDRACIEYTAKDNMKSSLVECANTRRMKSVWAPGPLSSFPRLYTLEALRKEIEVKKMKRDNIPHAVQAARQKRVEEYKQLYAKRR